MADPFTIGALANIVGLAANKFAGKAFGGRTQFDLTDPRKFKKDLVLSDGDINQMRQGALADLGSAQTASIANIKQAGAAGRLPEGATQSAIAGTAQNTAQGLARLEPGLQRLKRDSARDFLGLRQQFDAARMAHEEGNANQEAAFNQGAFGSLSRFAMMLGQDKIFGENKLKPLGFE